MVVHAVRGELASSNAALQATYIWVAERLETVQRKHIALTAIQAGLVVEVVELVEMERSLNRAQAVDTELEARMAGFLVTAAVFCLHVSVSFYRSSIYQFIILNAQPLHINSSHVQKPPIMCRSLFYLLRLVVIFGIMH